MKKLLTLILIVCLYSCGDSTNNNTLTNTDSIALEAIDSSVIMNDSTVLPLDSTKTGVTH